MRKPLRKVTGRAIPLCRVDVDTDQIIPARHLKRIERTGFGQFAFELWRKDPDFVLNDRRYFGAPIMIAGPNFGCGSSREHAAWALQDLGLRVIVAPSFADIFRGNCASIGLLTVELPESLTEMLADRSRRRPESEISVDLAKQTIFTDDGEALATFDMDPFVKDCLLEGLDAIDLTMADEDAIADFEAKRPEFLPRTNSLKEAK